MSFFVYILRSDLNDRFYVGFSGDPVRRLTEHNAGKVRSTKPYRPWALVYREQYDDALTARRRERQIKSMKSAVYLRRLIDDRSDG